MGDIPTTGLDQILFTKSLNPSRSNHTNSNLNLWYIWGFVIPVVRRIGAWSDSDSIRSRVCTVTKRYLVSQSVSISTRSSFSYVGSGKLFAHVNCLPDMWTSFRSELSITALKRMDQWLSNQPLLFSCGKRSMLKSPSIRIGWGLSLAKLTNDLDFGVPVGCPSNNPDHGYPYHQVYRLW